MQKQLLDFLQTDLQFVKGVGPVMAARLNDVLGGRRILDFLLHKPFAVRPREVTDSITNAVAGELITIPVQIKSYKPGGKFRNGGKRPAQFVAVDKYGATVTIQFFGDSYLDYWQEKLPIGSSRAVSGKLEYNNYTGATINHPDFVETVEQSDRIPKIQAIYPSGEGLTQKTFANIRDQVFNVLSNQSEMWKEFSSCSTPALAAGVGRVCDRGVGSLESFTSSNPPPGVHTGTADPRRKGGGERVQPFSGTTDIFITPGYKFKVVDVLLTNFHLPKSTLFMLVSAFAGVPEMRDAYAHAIAEKYRFFSYGDCCLLFKKES